MKYTYECGHWIDIPKIDKPPVKCPICAKKPKIISRETKDLKDVEVKTDKEDSMKTSSFKNSFTRKKDGITTK